MRAPDDSAVAGYARWTIRWRWPLVIAVVLVTAVMAAGMARLTFSNNYRVFFGPQNPQLRAFEELEKVYTKNDSIFFVVQPADRNVFTRRTLTALKELTDAAWHVPHSTRVDSIINFQHTSANEDDIKVEDLVSDPAQLSDAQLQEIRAVALAEPLLSGRMIAKDGSTTGVFVRIYPPGKSQREIPEAVAYVRKLADDIHARYPELRVELTGTTMLSAAFAEAPQADVKFLLPVMYGIFVVMLFVFLRSVSLVFITICLVGLSAGGALGVAGWMGVQLNGVSVSAPTVILTLAIADSIHVLLAMIELMQKEGYAKEDALVESFRVNARNVFLATLTTVVGFLSLNFGDAPPMWDLGNITALGVTLAWLYSVTFVPAMVAILPVRGRDLALNASLSMERLADWVIRRRTPLLVGMSALTIFLGVSILRFEINDKPVEYFHSDNPFRRGTEFLTDNLTGFYGMNISLPSGEPGGVNDPKYLATVSAFIDWLRARDDVAHVDSIADTMKRLNKTMHGDDPAYYRLPTDRELAAQYLLLYEMSLPYGLDLNDSINVDKSATRVSIANTDVDFKHLKEFKVEAEEWLRQNGLPAMHDVEGASPAVMFAYIAERNIRSMASGSVVAFILISLTLTVALRSVKMGLISIIPNLVPIAMAFGIWALMWGTVDFAISIVTGVAFGIIDDDSIHWLATYQRARSEQGLGTVEAVRYTFGSIGNALWANSLILVVGFGTLAFSAFWPNATMGLLTAITIAVALIADFLLLPPLLMLLDRDPEMVREEKLRAAV